MVSESHANIEFVKPLLSVTKFLAISPSYDFELKKLTHTGRHQFYCLTFDCIWTALTLYGLYGRYTYIFVYMSKTRIFLELSTIFLTYFVNVLTTATVTYRKSRRFEAMLQKFATTDDIIQKFKIIEKKTNSIYFEIAGLFSFAFLSIFFASYLWMSVVGFTYFRYYLFENFQRMHVMFVMWTLYKFVLALRQRFRLLKQVLSTVIEDYVLTHERIDFNSLNLNDKWTSEVRILAMLYTLLSEITDLFNDVFGWIVLFVMLNNVCGFLISAHTVITFETDSLTTPMVVGFVAFSLTFAAPSLTFGTVLASLCESTTREARETSDLAYKLLHDVNRIALTSRRRLCENVLLLAQQATTRHPFFTAAGFCNIDYAMLFTMIGIFTSYLLVVIQFIKLYEIPQNGAVDFLAPNITVLATFES